MSIINENAIYLGIMLRKQTIWAIPRILPEHYTLGITGV